jgi:lipid-A-disaccharide synthase-like uncharacterized protein
MSGSRSVSWDRCCSPPAFSSSSSRARWIPVAFWYFSIGGGLITLVYSFHLGKVGLPFLVAQLGGLFVYARNLHLVYREKRRRRAAS